MCSDKWHRQTVIVVETVQLFSKQLTNVSINTSASISEWAICNYTSAQGIIIRTLVSGFSVSIACMLEQWGLMTRQARHDMRLCRSKTLAM